GRLPDTGIICGGANQCSFGAENRRVEGEQNNAETVADLIALRVYDSQLSIARQDYESYESRDKSSGAVRPLPSWAMPVPPIQPHAAGRPAARERIGRRYSTTPAQRSYMRLPRADAGCERLAFACARASAVPPHAGGALIHIRQASCWCRLRPRPRK